MKFPKLSALFAGLLSTGGKEANVKVSSEGVTSEDHASLESAEQKLAAMEAENTRLTAENSTLTTKVTELSASVTSLKTEKATLTTENATLTTKVTELEKTVAEKPAGTATTVIAKEDDSKVEGVEKKYNTSVDAEAAQIREQNSKLNTFK